MQKLQKKMWVFPCFETTRIACHAAAAIRVAYYAARRRIDTLGVQYYCSLTMGVLDGQSILVFAWEPGADERLPAIVDAIAQLVGGSEVIQEEPRRCAWCNDVLELADDLLCGACSYQRAFLDC